MAQVQGPPPTITSVTPSGLSLKVVWDNDPYFPSNDATLIYIDTDINEMFSVLLNADQIAQEEYYLTEDLIVGNNYAVFFSLIYDGNTYNSNTVSAVFATVPNRPDFSAVDTGIDGYSEVLATVVSAGDNGEPILYMVFRILLEGGSVSTQQFPYDSVTNQYLLTGFVRDQDYIISAQAVNAIGYSNVSNSQHFRNNRSPDQPVLGVIDSGNNGYVDLPITGYNSTDNLSEITGFDVSYKTQTASEFITTFVSYPISTLGNYSITLSNFVGISPNLLENSTPYIFKVAAVNAYGSGLISNTSNAIPALRLEALNVVVTFPDSTTIRVDWNNNSASWPLTGITTVNFYQASVGYIGHQTVYNNSGTYTASLTQALVPNTVYGVTMNAENGSELYKGYTLVPPSLYGTYWVSPSLTDRQFIATSSDASATYATAPGQVSNITYSTSLDVIDPSIGSISFNWVAAPDNGSPITNYICTLYIVSGGERTPYSSPDYTNPVNTNTTNTTFNNLPVSNLYAIGIIAQNVVGDGEETFYPASPTSGITIIAAVPIVTNLHAAQTYYDENANPKFTGILTWNYSGPGQGYDVGDGRTNFNIFSVVDGSYNLLETIPYVDGITNYSYNLNLGNTVNATLTFAVQVSTYVELDNTPAYSLYVTNSVTTGVAPVISNIIVYQSGSAWFLTFTVTNNTAEAMIQNSVFSIVMPNPVSAVLPSPAGNSVNPVKTDYDASLVDTNGGSYTWNVQLNYAAIGNDYLTIGASNGYGCTIANNGWGN